MILDASALLAYLQCETGSELVESILPSAFVSTVNWSEVAQKLLAKDIDVQAIKKNLEILGLRFMVFDVKHAEKASELFAVSASFGLSLGDRACLATAMVEKMPVMTADKVWQKVPITVDVQVIR